MSTSLLLIVLASYTAQVAQKMLSRLDLLRQHSYTAQVAQK